MSIKNAHSSDVFTQLTRSIGVRLQAHPEPPYDSKHLHAVNWFDVRALWAYDLYNALAATSLRRVGGVPVFKGRLSKVLVGNEQDQRDVLLLVQYPGAEAFAGMLANRRFMLVSMLRELVVKRFSFGLSAASIASISPWGTHDSATYLVYHCRSDMQTHLQLLTELQASAEKFAVDSVFATRIKYTLSLERADKPAEAVDCLMDSFFVLRHSSASVLSDLADSSHFQKLLNHTNSAFVALFERLK